MPDTLRFDFGWVGPPGDCMRRLDYSKDGDYLEASAVADVLREAYDEFEEGDEGGTPFDVIHWIGHKLDIRP